MTFRSGTNGDGDAWQIFHPLRRAVSVALNQPTRRESKGEVLSSACVINHGDSQPQGTTGPISGSRQ
jgi:hypothetical protein